MRFQLFAAGPCGGDLQLKQFLPKTFQGVPFRVLSGPILPCIVLRSVPSESGLLGSTGDDALGSLPFASAMEWMVDLLHLCLLSLAL